MFFFVGNPPGRVLRPFKVFPSKAIFSCIFLFLNLINIINLNFKSGSICF